jgi:thioredoxin-related protein
MKTLAAFLLLAILASVPAYAGTGKKTQELTWKDLPSGLAEAKKANKKILLDVYTDWCKWCKKLDAEVYAEPAVSAYLQKNYITVKVNAENPDKFAFQGKQMNGPDIAQTFGVSGYPTIIFLDADGKQIDRLGGFVNAQQFLPILKFIGEDAYKTTSWDDYAKKNGLK